MNSIALLEDQRVEEEDVEKRDFEVSQILIISCSPLLTLLAT